MKIDYYIEPDRKKNLYCRISDGENSITFPLGYVITTVEWSEKKGEIPTEDPQHATLMNFKEYLIKRYHELITLEISISTVLETLRTEAEHLLTRQV